MLSLYFVYLDLGLDTRVFVCICFLEREATLSSLVYTHRLAPTRSLHTPSHTYSYSLHACHTSLPCKVRRRSHLPLLSTTHSRTYSYLLRNTRRRSRLPLSSTHTLSECTPKGAGSRRRDSVESLQRIERVCEKGAKESRAEAHLERGREVDGLVPTIYRPLTTGRRQRFTVTDLEGFVIT